MMFGTRYTWPSPMPCVIHVLMFRGDRDDDVANCEFYDLAEWTILSANQFLAFTSGDLCSEDPTKSDVL